MPLKTIRLELARNTEFPEGSARHGYEFVAPLNADGHLDADEWRSHKSACTVRRFWAGEDDEHGRLVHLGQGWRFHYEDDDPDDDEPLFKLDRHILVENEYVTVTEHDGVARPFRIVRVT